MGQEFYISRGWSDGTVQVYRSEKFKEVVTLLGEW